MQNVIWVDLVATVNAALVRRKFKADRGSKHLIEEDLVTLPGIIHADVICLA